MFLALEAAIPNSSWNTCSTEITDLVLLNCKTQKDFGCALIIMWWNEKERKITVLENASCVIMTSQSFIVDDVTIMHVNIS